MLLIGTDDHRHRQVDYAVQVLYYRRALVHDLPTETQCWEWHYGLDGR